MSEVLAKLRTIAERGSEGLEELPFLLALAALISLMIRGFTNGDLLLAIISLIVLPVVIGMEVTWWYLHPPR